jgi:vancomycin resistance protein YoaR
MKKFKLISLLIFSITLLHGSTVFAFFNTEEIIIKVNDREKKVPRGEFLSWIKYNPALKYDKNHFSSIENTYYCEISPIICAITKREIDSIHTKKIQEPTPDTENIKNFLSDLSAEFNQEPIDANFSIDGGRAVAFSMEKDGWRIDTDKSQKIISDLITTENATDTIELVYNTIKPEIKAKDVNKLGITEIIGEGKSNFSGSTRSRIHNIQVAANKFNGLIIKPGEEFSFVENLGPVDGEHGYKQELVIKRNKTELDYGGGVCQISTTVFRAAIYSGLEITARRNHAYPVHYYYPHGMDSTVYIPKPDLKFINNTGHHILVQYEINIPARELVFKFYGTKAGRKVEIDGPHVTSRESDGSMKTIFSQKVYDSDGTLILDDVFKSSYDSPNNYPQPGQEPILTEKPKKWSKSEWKDYKKAHGI